MRKMILTILGSALLAGSFVQAAVASEHHHVRKVHPAPVTTSESFRDSNAYLRRAPAPVWPAPSPIGRLRIISGTRRSRLLPAANRDAQRGPAMRRPSSVRNLAMLARNGSLQEISNSKAFIK
jgi:hypothetical protein